MCTSFLLTIIVKDGGGSENPPPLSRLQARLPSFHECCPGLMRFLGQKKRTLLPTTTAKARVPKFSHASASSCIFHRGLLGRTGDNFTSDKLHYGKRTLNLEILHLYNGQVPCLPCALEEDSLFLPRMFATQKSSKGSPE